MSEPAPEDILTDDEAMALGEAQMNELLRSGGGETPRSLRCAACGNTSVHMIKGADPAMMVKIMEYKAKRKTAGTEGVQTKAKLTLDYFREASDEDLAREFHAEG